jgi:hypothetical protein
VKSIVGIAALYAAAKLIFVPLAKAAYLILVALIFHLPVAGLRLIHGIRVRRYIVLRPTPVPRSSHSGRPLRSTLQHAKDLQ